MFKCVHGCTCCVFEHYVSSCNWRLFSCSTDFSFSCSTRSLSCSSMIFWFRLHTYQNQQHHSYTGKKAMMTFDEEAYSCCSVISFSLVSSSSRRLLICFWWISRWDWICFSTASWVNKVIHMKPVPACTLNTGKKNILFLNAFSFVHGITLVLYCNGFQPSSTHRRVSNTFFHLGS